VAAAPGQWTTVQKKKKAPKASSTPRPVVLTGDQRNFELIQGPKDKIRLTAVEIADLMSSINLALHQKGTEERVERLRQSLSLRIFGTTTKTTSLEALFKHRDLILNAARRKLASIVDLGANQQWTWAKVHGIQHAQRYLGKGGLRKLREELKAENKGLTIPTEIRWLARNEDIRAKLREGTKEATSVTFAISGEASFAYFRRHGVHLLGERYKVELFEEARPDALCGRCSVWGHVEPHCTATAPRCSLCAGDHHTKDHKCPVTGCKAKKGYPCPHMVPKCCNCKGPHSAQANACKAKGEARQLARGWRSPSPRRGESGAEAPEAPENETTSAPAAEGEMEVEVEEGSGGGTGEGEEGVVGMEE
jgi:hypothetical protein